METDFYSRQYVELVTDDHANEVTFLLGLRCTAPSSSGYFDPINGGEPPHGPEFEYTTIQVCAELVNNKVNTDIIDLTPGQFQALVGVEIEDALFAQACTEAAEQGGF